MDGIMLPLLIAAAVGLLAWSLSRAAMSLRNNPQRKIKQRLSTDGVSTQGPAANLSITMAEHATVPEFLATKPYIQRLRRKLSQGFPDTSLQKFLMIMGCLAVFPLLLGTLLSWNIFVTLIAAGVAGYLPMFILNMQRSKRQRLVSEQLPEAMDFLSRVLRAGHSLSTGFQMMSEELPAPVATEFRRCYDQHSLGQALEDGLREMVERVDSTDFSFFVTAVLIQRQSGGDLSEVLTNISSMVRQRLRLAKQVRAKTAEGRFTGYIMVAFPAIMFGICYFLNPELYGLFFKTTTGMMMLGAAVVLQALGLFMIKKITTLHV
jgi:tight adherence protein B